MMIVFVLAFLICVNPATGFVSASPQQYSSRSTLTRLHGGYDATIGADPNTPLQLFVLPSRTCPYVQRTHITLQELGIPFDMIEVVSTPDRKPDWFLKINPRGKVPALKVPSLGYDAIIYESAICNEFLCDYCSVTLKKDQKLMPSDPLLRAKIRLWNDHCDSSYSKTQFTYLMNKDASKDDELCGEMEGALQFYEDILADGGGPYLAGEDFTIADLHLFPFIQRMVITLKYWKGYELPSETFPNLLYWFDTCSKRESVIQSSMGEEKIIEVYKRFVEADYKFGGLNTN
jgi:glutathione S-transferase